MKAFILAAGEGKRLRPFTNNTPKPLFKIQDKALILWTIGLFTKQQKEE